MTDSGSKDWGLTLMLMGAFLAYPAITVMTDAHSTVVWNAKIQDFGIIYSYLTLFMAYGALIVCGIFLATGYQIIRSSNPKNV